MISRIVTLLFCIICTHTVLNRNQISKDVFYNYDKSGYYTYLPSIFIYDDLEKSDFHFEIAEKYRLGGGAKYGMYEMPNGRWINKYTIGVSLFELPGFLIAHSYCIASNAYKADGYSPPYKSALILSTILWSFLGLVVLRKFLLRHFTDRVAAIVLLCIGFGTNFYSYTAFDQGMSHNFSLFLFAGVLLCTDRWYEQQKKKDIVLLGILMGLVAITRPVNLLVALVPLLWGVHNKETFSARGKLLLSKYKDVLIAFISFFLIAFIQLCYWKYMSGHWLYFSYVGEGFNFKDPQIINGLFSFRKGWFVYTPLAFVGLLGLFFTPRKYAFGILVFFTVMIYVVFSWENWFYGGGFGARALIETLPIVAFPLGFLTTAVLSKGHVILKRTYICILSFFVFLNIYQSYQFLHEIIHSERMTSTYYWRVFLKAHAKKSDFQYLMTDEEVSEEIKKWHEN